MKKKHLSMLAIMMMLWLLTVPTLSSVNAQQITDWWTSTSSETKADTTTSDDFDKENATEVSADTSTSDDTSLTDSSDDLDFDTDTTTSTDQNATPTIDKLEWTITNNDDNTSEIKFEIPKWMLWNQSSKAKVQVEFCLANWTECAALDTLPSEVQEEMKNIALQKVDLWSLKWKLHVNSNWESHALTKLDDISKDWNVWLYNSRIEFDNTYDQFWSVEFVTVKMNWSLKAYQNEAWNWNKAIARINFVEDQWQNKLFPIFASQPIQVDSNDTPVVEPTKEEVKKTETWVELNIAIWLAVVWALCYLWYRKLNTLED